MHYICKKDKVQKQLEVAIRDLRKQLQERGRKKNRSRGKIQRFAKGPWVHQKRQKNIWNRNPKTQTWKRYCRRGNESLT